MQLEKIRSCSISKNGFLPHVKSPIIWGNFEDAAYPLCYLTKPKSMSKENFEKFINAFEFTLTLGKK